MANKDVQLKIDAILDTGGADVTYQGLTKQIKELNGLALQYKGTNKEAFDAVNKAAADLQGELNDVRDSMRAMDGSQLESVNNSVSLLNEGVGNLDFSKASNSLNILSKNVNSMNFGSLTDGVGDFTKSLLNLGKAILANPILLLASVAIAIVGAIYKLKDAGGLATKMFEVMGDALKYVTQLFKDFLDLIGLTDFAGQEKSKKVIENANREKEAINDRYNAELALLKATGATQQEIFNTQKQQYDALIKNNKKIIDSLNERKATGIKLNDEQKKQLKEAEKAHRDYVNAVKVLEAERKTAIEDANKAIDNTIEDLRVKRTKSQADDIKLTGERQKQAVAKSIATEEQKAKLIKEIDKNTQFELNKYYTDQSKARADKIKADADKSKADRQKLLQDELKDIETTNAIALSNTKDNTIERVNIIKDGTQKQIDFYKTYGKEIGLTENEITLKVIQLADQKKAAEKQYTDYVLDIQNKKLEADKQLKLNALNYTIETNNDELDRLDWLYENKHIATAEYFEKSKELLLANLEAQKEIELANTELTEQQRADIEKKYGDKRKQIEEDVNKQKLKSQQESIAKGLGYAQQFVSAISAINDAITANENARLKQGETATLSVQKKQFKRKKALEIVQANMSGAQAVLQALGSAPPPYSFILAGLAGVAAAVQIAAISRQKFNPSTGGGSNNSSGSSLSGSIPSSTSAIPAIQSFNIGQTPTPQPPNGGPDGQKVYVLESDITSTQNKVDVIESRSQFG